MTHIKHIDSYIQITQQAVKANPSGTRVSITYTHSKTRSKGTIIKFKTYNDKLGNCLTFKTYKVKEFNRLMNFFGPNGISITQKVQSKEKTENEEKKEVHKVIELDGISSILCNVKVDKTIVAPTPVIEKKDEKSTSSSAAVAGEEEKKTSAGGNSGKSKKNKKKGKKR